MNAIWRRRVALMAVVGLAVAVPVTLLIRDGDDEQPSATQPATTTSEAPPEVGPGVEDEGLGVRFGIPDDWKDSKEASAIRLSSPDSSAEIVIAAPAPAGEADAVLQQALDAFEAEYEDVKIAPGSGREIGGIEAKGAVVEASRDDQKLRVLVAVAPGEEDAYLVEVFTTAEISADRLREAQAVLNSLEFDA